MAARPARIRAARFPALKALEDFDYDHRRSLRREAIAHLSTLDFGTARENVAFLGPPGIGKTHLSIGVGIGACQAGHRVAFATAAKWVARLADAHAAGKFQDELVKMAKPFGKVHANLCKVGPKGHGFSDVGATSPRIAHGRTAPGSLVGAPARGPRLVGQGRT
ncbi:ATP-binding protein [Nonomuraea jabiensis]|uniref:ATP-binding protein n=1 Tax=Nonomuraea jabiensis TaxID=882448 RepID=UPI0036C28C77